MLVVKQSFYCLILDHTFMILIMTNPSFRWKESLSKFISGIVYFAFFMIGTQKVKTDYLTTNEFLVSFLNN